MRARDDVNADQFAHTARRGRARVSRGLDRRDFAAHDRCDESSADLLVTDQADVRRLDHRVGRFDHRHQPFRLDHSQSFHLFLAPFALLISLFDNFVAGNHTASVLAMRPLPDHFFFFTQIHTQNLSGQSRAALKGRLDDAFLLSLFHLLPPSGLARLSLKQSRRFHQQFHKLRASQGYSFRVLRRNGTYGTNRTYGTDLAGPRFRPHCSVAFADFKKLFDRAIRNRVFVAERAGDKAYFTGMFQRFELVEGLFKSV